MSGGQALAPLRDRRFRLLFMGRATSMLGSAMAPIALAFAVLGIVLASRSIPMAAFMLLGGVVADRFSRSLVLQVSHLLSALSQATVAFLLLTGTAEIWSLVVLEAVNGTVDCGDGARRHGRRRVGARRRCPDLAGGRLVHGAPPSPGSRASRLDVGGA